MANLPSPFARLVPRLVVRQLRARAGDPLRPWRRPVEGAVLMADVAGFTALAESLAAAGPAAGERLSILLNACFGRLADEIAACGGDVLGFAGDAPLAIFDDLERARACAARLQHAMADVRRDAGSPLSIRIAIAQGSLVELGLGGVDGRWHWLVGGAPFDALRRLLSTTPPNGIGSDVTGDLTGPGPPPGAPAPDAWRLPALDGAPADVRRFVPRSVAARIDAGQADWVAELRRITAMFVTLRGVDYSRPDAADRLQSVVAMLQSTVHRAGGSINQILADDKGTTVVCGWGLPGHAHDNDPELATLAGLRAAGALRQSGDDFGVGLASGRAFCGWRGNARRREFAVIGSVVNLAARLSAASTRTVLVDADTHAGASRRVAFGDATPRTVKGRATPVETWEAQAERAPTPVGDGQPSGMVGRVAERERLARAIEAAAGGRGGVCILEGDPGAGKSTLLDVTRRLALDRGLRVVTGAGRPVGRAGGYDAWHDLLPQLLDVDPAGPPDVRRAAAEARLGDRRELADRIPLLGPLLDAEIPDTVVTARLTAPLRAEGARELLTALVGDALADGPVMLVLDDAQWLDSLSWSAASVVSRRLPSLLLVIATRPIDDPPSEWQDLSARAGDGRLRLGGLTADETVELARRLLGVDVLPDALVNLLTEKTGGHPLFVAEFARWLRDTGIVQVAGGRARFDREALERQPDPPASVEGVILHRLDQLPAPLQLTLRVASVLGQTFTVDALAVTHPVTPDRASVLRDLDACERLGFLETSPAGTAFTHALLRDVTYQLMPTAQRISLHRGVADWYEASAHDEPPDALLAYHREGAEEFARAVPHLDRAAARAWDQGASRETLRFLQRATALATRAGLDEPVMTRATRHRIAGRAAVGLGEIPMAQRELRAALRLLGLHYPESQRGIRARMLLELGRQAGHLIAAPASARRRPVAVREQVTEVVRALKALGDAAFYEADHLGYLTTSLTAINRAERAGVTREAAVAYTAAAYTAALFKLRPLARRWWRMAGRPADAEARLALLVTKSMVALQEARWDRQRRLTTRIIASARRLGSSAVVDTGLVMAIISAFQGGRLEEGFEAGRALLESASSQGNETHQLWAYQAMANIRLVQGRREEGLAYSRQAIALVAHVGDPLTIAQHYAHLLAVARLTADRRGAVEAAAALAARMRETPPSSVGTMAPFGELASYALDAWSEARHAGGAEARRAAREARWATGQLRRYASLFPYGRPLYLVARGRVAWYGGHRRAAERWWTRAARAAVATGQPIIEADAWRCLGHLSRSGADQGAAYRQRAEAIYHRLGIAPDARLAVRPVDDSERLERST